MPQSNTISTLGTLLIAVTAVTILDSYVPHEMTSLRHLIAMVLLGLMFAIGAVTLRSLLREF